MARTGADVGVEVWLLVLSALFLLAGIFSTDDQNLAQGSGFFAGSATLFAGWAVVRALHRLRGGARP